MTNKEAILMLERIMYDEDNHGIEWAAGAKQAFEMAISTLKCMSLNADIINADAMHKLFVTGEMTIEDFKKMCGKEIKHEM